MSACEAALSGLVDWSLSNVLRGEGDPQLLERVDVVQPCLWAVMVSLASLWRSFGVEPSVVVGHSQGEIAAATVAGGLSLEDGARVVALRSLAVREALAGQGTMASISLAPDAVEERLGRVDGVVSIAAVNGPTSVVVAGDNQAVADLVAGCESDGVCARRIPVDYPSHSPFVEAIEARVLADLAGIRPRSGQVAMVSTVTAAPVDTAEMDAAYWYRGLRHQVRFLEATRALVGAGAGAFVEVSPHPGLTMSLQDSVGEATIPVLGTLRRGHGGADEVTRALAQAHVSGLPVDWAPFWSGRGAQPVELPTYAFQRQRFWLDAPTGGGDLAGTGLAGSDHPFLAAAVRLAGRDDEWLFTGLLSPADHPWLADHRVDDTVIVPATALADLAVLVGRQVGCDALAELLLEAPLVLAGDRGVRLQVTVGGPDDAGRREVAVYTGDEDAEWVRHAAGVLAPADADAAPGPDLAADVADLTEAWPPPGADAVDVSALYDGMADMGFGYGPAFQGIEAAWQRGDEVFAEVALDEDHAGDADRFGVHPALFDAALHGYALLGVEGAEPGSVSLPFSLAGVRIHRAGAGSLRVRLARAGGGVTVTAVDPVGNLVASVDTLTFRSLAAGRLGLLAASAGAAVDDLYGLDWTPVAVADAVTGDADAGSDEAPGDLTVVEAGDAAGALVALQAWLADDADAGGRLAIVTRAAVAAAPGEAPDPEAAGVWGLVRSAQAEHPDRFLLVDVEPDAEPGVAWAALVATGEPQLAVRGDRVSAPRLARLTASVGAGRSLAGATVLVTGGLGVVGGLVARHLARAHGVGHLVLLGRRGEDSPGADELRRDLEASGCAVTIAACDAADRDQLAAVIAAVPDDRPLTAVVHAAGALDDAMVESLTPEHMARVMRPKLDAASNLDELTADLDLAAFVLFSSASGTFGSPGQANYAAANAALDALALRRRASGRPAQSLPWGFWAEASGMTGHLDDADVARLRRLGMVPLTNERGLELFDAALASDAALVLPVGLDTAALRSQARVGLLPALFRGLVQAPARRQRQGAGSLSRRLAAAPEAEWDAVVLDVVRSQVADMLGYDAPDEVEPDRPFKDLGYDSLPRPRTAQPPGSGHRCAPAGHARLRPSHQRGGGPPAAPAGRGRRAPRPGGERRPPAPRRDGGRTVGHRGHGVPVPGWRPLARRPVGPGGRAGRRHLRVPGRPRLGPRPALRRRPGQPRDLVCPRGRVPGGRRQLRRRVLRHRAA